MSVFARKSLLFEYAVIAVLVSVLLAVASAYYQQLIGRTQTAALHLQAANFARAMETVRLYWQMQGQSVTVLEREGVTYQVNDNGWPVAVLSAAAITASAPGVRRANQRCKSLFDLLINASNSASLNTTGTLNSDTKGTIAVSATALLGLGCRYQLHFAGTGLFYFDYHVDSGLVKVGSAREP